MDRQTTQPAILLAPADWLWAPWRATAPLERPAPAPFDRAAALRRVAQITVGSQPWDWRWDQVGLEPALTPEAARFWLWALARSGSRTTPAELAAELAEIGLDSGPTWEQGRSMIRHGYGSEQSWMLLPLAHLWPPEQIVELILAQYHKHHTTTPFALLCGFRRHVLPYLDPPTRARLSALLAARLDPAGWPGDGYTGGPPAWYLAAQLGGQAAALRALVESWPDACFAQGAADYHQHPQLVIFGLDQPALVARHLGRVGLRLSCPDDIRAWLAHTELSALDMVRDSILAEQSKDRAAELTEVFALVQAAEAAPHMLALTLDSKAPGAARAWLQEHSEQSIAGLLPLAEGHDRLGQAAAGLLRRLARRGHSAPIAAALGGLPDERAARLRAALLPADELLPELDPASTPAWLSDALAQVKPSKLPAWLNPADLPPLPLGQRRLSPAQTRALLQALQQSPLGAPHALVRALAAQTERASAARFAWELFELWLQSDAPSKDLWAMQALGPLADDAATLRLAALIQVWPGESQHQRAVKGLEVLGAVGSDTALMQIDGVARRVKFKALRERATQTLEQIALARGLSRAELEDRIVPDCGLDQRGERVFDFGPRQFRFALGPELKPLLRDAQGALRPDLPKPNAKDQPALAAQALADWKLLKKQVAEVASVQARRLEQALVDGRRWPAPDFERLLVRHPLLTHLVRTLIWRSYAADGTPGPSFRVAEDGGCADAQERPLALAPDASVGLLHPLQASEAERNAWGELLSDYAIAPPFPQLSRPVQRLEPHERAQTEIARFGQIRIPAATLVFGLDQRGWTRDAPADGGGFAGHFKPFAQFDLSAVIQYEDGVAVGWITDAPPQRIRYVAFVPGLLKAQGWPEHRSRLELGQVDPLVLSEVLNDIAGIAARAA